MVNNGREEIVSYTGGQQWSEDFILGHLPLIKKIASRLSMALPPSLEEDDLIGSGIIGLMEACNRFEPSRGIDFLAFASQRIKGAMIDELRRLNRVSRSLFPRWRKLQETVETLSHRWKKEPTPEEVAAELGWAVSQVEQTRASFNYLAVMSLDRLLFTDGEGEGVSLEERMAGPSAEPSEVLERKEKQQLLSAAIERLSTNHKLVLSLYYKEELSQKEIAM